MDTKHIVQQLYPAWTGVNIGIMIIGFLIWWPIGLFMCAYMQWGASWGLDLRRWETFPTTASKAWDKARQFVGGGISSLQQDTVRPTGSPSATASNEKSSFEQWRDNEKRSLEQERRELETERAALRKERQALEAEKKQSRTT